MGKLLILMVVGVIALAIACSDGPTTPTDARDATIDSLGVVLDSLRGDNDSLALWLGRYRCLNQQMRPYVPDTARIECGV